MSNDEVLRTQNFKCAAETCRRAEDLYKNLVVVGLALVALCCGPSGDMRNSAENKPPSNVSPPVAANKSASNVQTTPPERKRIISGVMLEMPDPSPRAFERWLYGNRALSGAKWQKPEGHVPGQYVAKYTDKKAKAELIALLEGDDRFEARRIQYVSLSITSVADLSSKAARGEVSDVARAVFGKEAGNRMALAMESDGNDSPPSRGDGSKWRFTISESYNRVLIDVVPAKKE